MTTAGLLETLGSALAGQYAVEREVGRGGMATVFLAQDLKHHRQVAIKVLHAELASALGAERFLKEIETAARLQHPHILPLYDSGSAAGFLYYVMPFVEGESLRDRLERERQLPLEDALKITSEVASALAYAHGHGVVHRDMKPENIMLSGGSAVVADFGIARAISAADQSHLTQTGTVVGTPTYMSPEQATGSAEIDGRSDQYSLACVLYEMVVGQPPFTGPTPQAVMARHSLDMVSPPSIVRNTIPDAVEDAILRALSKVPADRYPTVALFAEALARPSPATGAKRRLTQARMSVGKRPWARRLVWAAPVLVLLAAAWAARSLWSGSRRSGASEEGVDPRRIAVLYFEDRSEGGRLRYLADGFTEALIREVGQVESLQVVSRNGVAPYRDTRATSDSIGRALKVGTLVQGTVAQSGDRLRVTVEMINTSNGRVIGASQPLERVRQDVFALQDDLAKEVSRFLRQRLGQVVQQLEARAGTNNVAAWELVQQAEAATKDVDSLLAAGDTSGAARQLAHGDSLLARAVAMDRRWVAPVAQRGWLAYKRLDLVGTFNKDYYATWIQRGQEYADAALALKPDDPDALTLRGYMRYWRFLLNLDPDPSGATKLLADAEQDLRAGAVAANPSRARAWVMLSSLLARKSEPAEAKLAALRAYEADPYLTEASTVLWRLFQNSLDLEDGVEATHWCEEGRRRFPTEARFVECRISRFALEGQKPDVPAAWALLEEYVTLYHPNEREFRRRWGQMLVAMNLVRAGLPDSARAVAARARADAKIDPTRSLAYVEAMVRNMLGDRDEALRLLNQYLAANPPDRASMAKDDTWWWRGLRDDPRFKQLVGVGP
ncbi:MAG TPA: serine/threonine-protein kinase [Gemmatimonadales bacterium]|nr:serine/threonine-protein kinase [Gemmatimonadales bacterium]